MDTKTNPVEPALIQRDDLMAFTYWAKVEASNRNGSELSLVNVDTNEKFFVSGKNLVEISMSADRHSDTEYVTKTKAAEILVSSFNVPFTVVFDKANGQSRTLRGRLVKAEPLLGRSMVEDLDIDVTMHRLRQVDHRTIKSLVVGGVKYIVK